MRSAYIQNVCLLWGRRVVVPLANRQVVLDLLHEAHPRYPEIDSVMKACYECQRSHHSPPVAPSHPWEWPQHPWAHIHIDYAGRVEGRILLVVVDSHSKWVDIAVVTSATSFITIEILREIFCTHGTPDVVVSDNGKAFVTWHVKIGHICTQNLALFLNFN